MNPQLLGTVLVASAVGSLHCVGMCGGFVAFYSVGTEGRGVLRLLPHLFYHLGRLVTYVTLGLAAGTLGRIVDLAGKAAGLGRVAALLAGAVMVLWGLSLLLARAGLKWHAPKLFPSVSQLLGRGMRALASKPPMVRAALLGLSSTLLPCGFLYAFVVTAAGTAAAWSGALVMLAFWAGTVPLLLGLGIGTEQIGARLRRHIPTVTALLMVALGAYTVVGRVNVSYLIAQRLESQLSTSQQKAAPGGAHIMPADCPCHRH